MQLKFNKTIKKRIIIIELETRGFNVQEENLLKALGEPVIKFEKMYKNKYPVQFEKKIKTGFKLKVKFDGTKDIEEASEAAEEFFEEIQESLEEAMAELEEKASDSEFKIENGIINIKY